MTDTATATLASFVAERIRDLRERKSLEQIAADAGLRKTDLLTRISLGDATLPLDRVPGFARGLECDLHELMRLALPQFMEPWLVRLVWDSGAAEMKRELDKMGASLIALATNMRTAIDTIRRSCAAVQTHAELVEKDFNRLDDLRIQIERQAAAIVGYPSKPASDPVTE